MKEARLFALVLVFASPASAAVNQFVTFEGTPSSNQTMHVLLLPSSATPTPPNPTATGDMITTITSGETARVIRDELMPGFGDSWEAGRLIAATKSDRPGFLYASSTMPTNIWVRSNTSGWLLVEPGVPLAFFGLTLHHEIGGEITTSVGSTAVPAVSTWGLAALALLILTGGSFIVLANRSRVAA